MGIPQQSPLLEQVEQFKDDHDNDNYSDYIEDSVHVGANIRVCVWWPAFILAHMMLVIRVYDDAGDVIETHEHKGDFKEW